MTKITYQPQNGRKINGTRRWAEDVYVDGKRVGYIEGRATGWCYKPLGGKEGPTFPTLNALKRDIEGDGE